MVSPANEIWTATISGVSPGDDVDYYLYAADESGRQSFHPFIGQADPHEFETIGGITEDLEMNPDTLVYLDFEDMIDLLVPLIERDPEFGSAYDWLGMAYVQLERFDESIATYRKAVELSDNTMEVVSGLGHAYGMAGRHDEAREVLAMMHTAAEQTYVPQVQIAFVHAGLGDTEGAFEQLQLAFDAKAWEISFMAAEPWLEHLAEDPRFKEMVRKVGFPS